MSDLEICVTVEDGRPVSVSFNVESRSEAVLMLREAAARLEGGAFPWRMVGTVSTEDSK